MTAKPATTWTPKTLTAKRKCAGACRKPLVVTRFPTMQVKDGIVRGTECRTCRDARREAARAAR